MLRLARSCKFVRTSSPYNKFRLLSTAVNEFETVYDFDSIGQLANASCLARRGNTVVHAAVSLEKMEREQSGGGGLPLKVDYRDRQYAHRRIPMSWTRRERNSTDPEILASRVVDRAIRPLFPKGLKCIPQVILTAHSVDGHTDPITLAVNATSAALMKSSIPWGNAEMIDGEMGLIPVGCVRVGMVDGQIVVDPSVQDHDASLFDLLYAGTEEGAIMIELTGREPSQEVMTEALELAHTSVQQRIWEQRQAVGEMAYSGDGARAEEWLDAPPPALKKYVMSTGVKDAKAMFHAMAAAGARPELDPNNLTPKQVRGQAQGAIMSDLRRRCATWWAAQAAHLSILPGPIEESADVVHHSPSSASPVSWRGILKPWLDVEADVPEPISHVHDEIDCDPSSAALVTGSSAMHRRLTDAVVESVLAEGFREAYFAEPQETLQRMDGRLSLDVRGLDANIGPFPSGHGNAIFSRGETSVMSTTTLGSLMDARERNTVIGKPEVLESFFLHYDFPPYSTGSVGNLSVSRRVIGHGNLAERAMMAVIPDVMEFPYTIRALCETTASSGSSSMASTTAASLSMIDAGVPIKDIVAGVSIGLVPAPSSIAADVQNNSQYRYLVDILGSEDYFGAMDFKIAGTKRGVTAAQLDVKLPRGVPIDVIVGALDLAAKKRATLINYAHKELRQKKNMTLDRRVDASTMVHASTKLPYRYPGLKPTAPRAVMVRYDPAKRDILLGPGGEMRRMIQNYYSVSVDLTNEGEAYFYGDASCSMAAAQSLVNDLVSTVEPGAVVEARVIKIQDYGVAVQLSRSQEAFLYAYDITNDKELRNKPLDEILRVGMTIDVKVTDVDKVHGTVRVSRKQLLDSSSESKKVSRDRDLRQRYAESLKESSVVNTGADAHSNISIQPPRGWSREFFRYNVANVSNTCEQDESQTTAPSGSGKDDVIPGIGRFGMRSNSTRTRKPTNSKGHKKSSSASGGSGDSLKYKNPRKFSMGGRRKNATGDVTRSTLIAGAKSDDDGDDNIVDEHLLSHAMVRKLGRKLGKMNKDEKAVWKALMQVRKSSQGDSSDSHDMDSDALPLAPSTSSETSSSSPADFDAEAPRASGESNKTVNYTISFKDVLQEKTETP